MINPIQGLFFRDMNNDFVAHIIKEIWFDRVYDTYLEGKNDLTVIDVGANVGLFSYYIAPKSTKIFALEPSEPHFETLSKMIEFNGLSEKILPFKMALANKEGELPFYHNVNTTMYSLKPEVNTIPEEAEVVQTVNLETFFNLYDIDHIDVLKMDCEGSEAEIFAGEAFEKTAPKIDLILGEYHQWTGVNPEQFKNSITDRGFSFEWTNKTQASTFAARRIK